MSDEPSISDRLALVERLTAELTDQVLDAQIMKRPIFDDQAQALAKAARLLHDHDLPWPPMLTQVLQELAGSVEADRSKEQDALVQSEGNSVVEGLTRFMNAFRKERDRS